MLLRSLSFGAIFCIGRWGLLPSRLQPSQGTMALSNASQEAPWPFRRKLKDTSVLDLTIEFSALGHTKADPKKTTGPGVHRSASRPKFSLFTKRSVTCPA